MPVPLINVPACAVCQALKGKLNRWFLTRVRGKEFSYTEYNDALLAEYDQAVCGREHLDVLHHAHADALIGLRGKRVAEAAARAPEIVAEGSK